MRKLLALITLPLAGLATGCSVMDLPTDPAPQTTPVCVPNDQGYVVTVDGTPLGCDVIAGQTLVVMDPLTPCPDMGGVMDGDACVGVDF